MRKVLITVLERDGLPAGIDPVTPDKCMEAEMRLQRYTWKRVCQSLDTLREARVFVFVRIHALCGKRKQLLYLERLGMTASARAQNAECLVASFAPQLRTFVRKMGHNKNWARDRLRYTFELELSDGEVTCFPPLRHPTLTKLLRAT